MKEAPLYRAKYVGVVSGPKCAAGLEYAKSMPNAKLGVTDCKKLACNAPVYMPSRIDGDCASIFAVKSLPVYTLLTISCV